MKNKLTIFFYLVLCLMGYTQELVVNPDPQADIAPNIAPQTQGRSANLWINNTETTNIQLIASDQDGDALTFTLVTPPTNGTVTITETQAIGIVNQYVASYTPTTAFTSTSPYTQVDSFTFKVNDGQEDSNISTVNINSFPKDEKHNWTHSFNGEISKTIYDAQGNAYQVGSFSQSLSNRSSILQELKTGSSIHAKCGRNLKACLL